MPQENEKYPIGGATDNTEFTRVHQCKVTPFSIVEKEKDNVSTFQIVVGNNIISEKKFKSFKDALMYINSKPYELIINLSILTYNLFKENEMESKS